MLPLLPKQDHEKIFKRLKTFSDSYEEDFKKDLLGFISYIERTWLYKFDDVDDNLFNFNKLAKTKTTNPAESYHSLMKR